MSDTRPSFIVTIDTEGDNLWARPRRITTRNALFLGRFQALCESYGLRPTYLTTWEMAESPLFQEFANDALERNAGEVGMHLHAWSTPPETPLTEDDHRYLPYVTEYPRADMAAKIEALTTKLEDTFDTSIRSHRGGRWALDGTYAALLVEAGYRVDCSVTPLLSWSSSPGARGEAGPDYALVPARRGAGHDVRRRPPAAGRVGPGPGAGPPARGARTEPAVPGGALAAARRAQRS